MLRLLSGRDSETVGAALDSQSPVSRILWGPLAKAVMNLDPAHAAAGPFARTLRRTVLRGASAMRVGVAQQSLASSFVEPALGHLARTGIGIRLGVRLRALDISGSEISALGFGEAAVRLRPRDRVILAIPPWELSRLLPGVAPSHRTSAIINLHARLVDAPVAGPPRLIGLVDREVEWILQRGKIVCACVSAADRWIDSDAEEVAGRLWRDVADALGVHGGFSRPTCRLIKERRATPAQTPAFESRRPGPMTHLPQALIAGDWVQPGLPCTIESAIASGVAAAECALESST
ncbi:MAG: hypothetical protein FJX57_17140 [Alphaproteobacteria bacterium]|nr:hypothetical protein [Alphaproteobacteria bacterium]